MSRFRRILALLAILSQVVAGTSPAWACTGITIKTKGDNAVVFARTLEFADDIMSNLIIVPRGKKYVGTTPTDLRDAHSGHEWTMKYGCVGTNAFDLPITVDGLNEKGLQVALFYFPRFAKYQEFTTGTDSGKVLAPWELGTFLLGTCADVPEAVAAAKSVVVAEVKQLDMGFVPPVHYVLTDASGVSKVLEYVDGKLKVHNNPLGVMTNSPTFDWHMTNLSNYVNMTVNNVPEVDVDGKAINGLGQGSGMLGIPGDFTPPSRFVRAVAFTKSALPVETAPEAVLQAFHILNQFDIPKGAARGIEVHEGMRKEVADYTLWTSASDLKNLRYYFRTYANSRIRMVDLKAVKFDAKKIKTISFKGDEQIEDVTASAK